MNLEFSLIALHVQNVFTVLVERRVQVPFSMAIENGELVYECSPEHMRKETERFKLDNETEEENESECGRKYSGHEKKKSCPVTLSCPVPI